MKKALLISKTEVRTGMGKMAIQKHYKLSEPLEGDDYVVVSAAPTIDHGDETYIFGANKKGEVTSWSEKPGSFIGGLDHEKALLGAGYEVES